MFGNAPKALWTRWITPDDENRIPLACRALLVTDLNGMNVLFETGIGCFFEPKMKERFGVVEDRHVLLDSLAEHGFQHEDIDAVVLSHLHFDHAGGLLAAYEEGEPLRLLFPNARYIVGNEAFERCVNPHPRDRASFIPGLADLLKDSGRLELVDGDRSPTLGDAVRFEKSYGHTPGMIHAEIGGDGGIVYCADLIPGAPWVHVPISMGYDRYPEKLIDEKTQFLKDKMRRGVRLFFTHDSEVAMAEVDQDEKGRFRATNPVAELNGVAA